MSFKNLLGRLARAEAGSTGGLCRCPTPPGGGAWDVGGLLLAGGVCLRAVCPVCGGSHQVEIVEQVVPPSEPEPE